MLPDKVKVLNIPLFPYLQPGQKKVGPARRLRPIDSLNLKKIVRELDKNTIITLDINGKPWSVVSVYSSYSPDVHIMLFEKSTNRFLPGPEKVPAPEGRLLMSVWAAILEFIADRNINSSIHSGYNWSPRSWGIEEEKTGFASLPTKWHPHIWGWPSLESRKTSKQNFLKFLPAQSLPQAEQRILGNNDYAEPIGLLIIDKIRQNFRRKSLLFNLFPYKNWQVDGRGIYAVSDLLLPDILRHEKFFPNILKPAAALLDNIFGDLTEKLTDMNCREIDRILLETQKGFPKSWKKLRKRPCMKSPENILRQFKQSGYPDSLLNVIFDAVRNRCNEQGNPQNWWRKGFGYALVFSSRIEDKNTELRIMPGVYVGPGGVVEALGVILRRPEDKWLSDTQVKEKSHILWNLAEYLKQLGFREYNKPAN